MTTTNSVCSRLADLLEREQQGITEQWLLSVRIDRHIESSKRLTPEELLDHLPVLYQELCSFLRSRDPETLKVDLQHDASAHGWERWLSGYSMDEVLRELELLRRIIMVQTMQRFVERERASLTPMLEATARTLLHEFFAQVTISSAQRYMIEHAHREQMHHQRLQEANRALSDSLASRQRLTAVIAHELRNFIQGLSAATTLVRKQPHNEQIHALARQQIGDMQLLLEQLLEHSTMLGANQRAPESFQPSVLCAELVAAYRERAESKGLELLLDCEGSPSSVVNDRLKVKQVLTNLLSNAIKYTPSGRVTLAMNTVDESHWMASVADTGPGISPLQSTRVHVGLGDDQEHLPGRGIGLGIVKDLVDLLQGSLTVHSAKEGTCFEVVLPRTMPRDVH